MPSPQISLDEAAVKLGDALRSRRKSLGLSQDQLAAKIGHDVTRQQISLIENGYSGARGGKPGNPEFETLLALCRGLKARLVIDFVHPTTLKIEFDDGS